MTVKILIKRKLKEGKMQEASKMLLQARTNAMGKQGYISSETLSGCDDPNEVLVLSMWRSKEDWERYKTDPARQEVEKQFAYLLEGETQIESYQLGLPH